jgi:hypothetical protein
MRTRAERETIIRFDETDEPAYLWTASAIQRRRWERLGLRVEAAGGGWRTRVDKRRVSVRRARRQTPAGVPGHILHDFRRTAVRNLERAGVSRSAAMAMVGHKTESIYRRYAIVDEAMQHEAAAKIDIAAGTFSGTGPGIRGKAAGGHSA